MRPLAKTRNYDEVINCLPQLLSLYPFPPPPPLSPRLPPPSPQTPQQPKPHLKEGNSLTTPPPDDGTAIPNIAASKVDTYCSAADNICVDGDLILPAHLLYGENAAAAAAFVVSAAA